MKIVIGADDAGAPLLEVVAEYLKGHPEIEVVDLSTPQRDDEYYPDVAERVANAVAHDEAQRGILVCGTGIGMSITANKIPGIRAALTHDTYSAERASLSNNAQIITMGSRVIGAEVAKAIVETWLKAEFDWNSRSGPKVRRMNEIDAKYLKRDESGSE
jgi:ribose 5-phosphate isomerase B